MTRCLKSLSNPVALPDLCFDSFSYPVAFIVSVTWLLWHYFFYCFFFSQSQILSGKEQGRSLKLLVVADNFRR